MLTHTVTVHYHRTADVVCTPNKNDVFKSHCTGTVQSQGKRVRNVKPVSFKPGLEYCYGRRGSDKIWQTVPDTCNGGQESSVTDSRESGAADQIYCFISSELFC